ncbi:MAG: solute symporter family protein, partial [Hyphomicrobiaceae bacterium]
MSFTPQARLVNPRLGIYFGIFASTFAAVAILLLIFEQLGAPPDVLQWSMLVVPVVLYAAIGLASATDEPLDYFAGGRRVPAGFNGVALAVSAAGGTGLVALTGVFFFNGFDAWSIAIGFSAGFVVMAVAIAPYYRKCGSFTVPGYFGRRFDSRVLRLMTAAVAAVPILLVIAAELRIGMFAAAWLTGLDRSTAAFALTMVIVVTVSLGGMRSLTWSGVAQSIAALLALLVPTVVVAVILTNLPLPQLSYGPVLRNLARAEQVQGLSMQTLPPFAYELAGSGLAAIAQRFAAPFGSIGPAAFAVLSLTVMAGIAAAPWLVPRCGTTPGVYEARKSLGWSLVVFGVAVLTVSAAAVFMRVAVMDTLAGKPIDQSPDWFRTLGVLGHVGYERIDAAVSTFPVSAFGFRRDAILFALPMAAELPSVVLHLALAGAIAAVLAAAGAAAMALAAIVTEDIVFGLTKPPPDTLRLTAGRLGLAAAAVGGAWIAVEVPADPLHLLLWALAIGASALFPVLVLSIWWTQFNVWGCGAGMTAGFAAAVAAILAGESQMLGVHSVLAGAFGIPAGFAAAAAVTALVPASNAGEQDI